MFCFLEVLDGLNVLAPELLVEFMDPLDELWRRIRLSLVFGFGFLLISLGFGRRRVSLGIRLWLRLSWGDPLE